MKIQGIEVFDSISSEKRWSKNSSLSCLVKDKSALISCYKLKLKKQTVFFKALNFM